MQFTRNNTAVQFYNSLPPWAKGVVVVGGLAVTYLVVKGILDKIKSDAALKQQRGTLDNQNQELQNIINAGIKPTFPQSQYGQWADEIQNQFEGCDYTNPIPFVPPTWLFNHNWSNSGAMFANIVLKLENDADFLALQTAYDIRTYDQCLWGTGNVTGTLSKAVNDELQDVEINSINQYLESKGITYKY
jgi:hypothetical protein